MNKAQWFLTPALKFIIVIWTLRGQCRNLIWFFPLKEQEWPSAREGEKKAFEEKATKGERHFLFEVKRITYSEISWLVIIIFISIIIIVIFIAIIVFIIVFIKSTQIYLDPSGGDVEGEDRLDREDEESGFEVFNTEILENSKYDVGPFYIQLSSCKDNEGASNSAEEDDVDQEEEGRSHLLYNNSDDSDQGDYDLADDDEDDDGENEDWDDDGDNDEDGKMMIEKTSPVKQQLWWLQSRLFYFHFHFHWLWSGVDLECICQFVAVMVLSFGRWEVHCATRVFCQGRLLILFCLHLMMMMIRRETMVMLMMMVTIKMMMTSLMSCFVRRSFWRWGRWRTWGGEGGLGGAHYNTEGAAEVSSSLSPSLSPTSSSSSLSSSSTPPRWE